MRLAGTPSGGVRRRTRRAVLATLLLLAACGPVPQPFRPDDDSKVHNPFLFVSDGAGVTVLRVEGPVPWVGEALAEQMALALRKYDVAASAQSSNRAAYVLASTGLQQLYDDKPSELVLTWTLADSGGTVIGEHELRMDPPEGFWHEPKAGMFKTVAERSAPAVANWIRPQIAGKGDALAAVAIGLVDGAPGDGATALPTALAAFLKRDRVEIHTAQSPAPVTVTADVLVETAGGGADRVRIDWKVKLRDGRQLGVVSQDNLVPTGSLDAHWGGIAIAAADAASGGIKELLIELRRSEEQRARTKQE